MRLEDEIKADASGKYSHLVGVPKALLPTKTSKTLLDCWSVLVLVLYFAPTSLQARCCLTCTASSAACRWEAIQVCNKFDGVYLVTNAEKYKVSFFP